MTTTANPQVKATTIHCRNGETITLVEQASGAVAVTFTNRPLYNSTFTAERIACDEPPWQAATAYAGQLANENGGPVQPRIARHRDAKHATITLTPCEGPEQRWLVATCYAGSRNIAKDGDRDITFSAPNLDRALAMGTALASVFNTITIAAAFDVLPAIKSLFGLAA